MLELLNIAYVISSYVTLSLTVCIQVAGKVDINEQERAN